MVKVLPRSWSLVVLAALIPGIHLHGNGSSTRPAAELPPGSWTFGSVLQPSKAVPPKGTYVLKSSDGKTCIKATMGAEYIITDQQTWYFNLDPSRVRTSGSCGKDAAVLSLTLPDDGASLQFTFRKDGGRVYVTTLAARLSAQPVCQKCSNKTYAGLLDHKKLFLSKKGESFTCTSVNLLSMSPQLKLKLVPLQLQAFSLPDGQFVKEVECWADFNRRLIPIVTGAAVVGLILIAVLTHQFIRDRHRPGYSRF